MTAGRFITFEGGEGGGKSTQSKLLLESFANSAIKAIHTREPGGTDGAETIREILVKGEVNRWDPITETLLHLAARKDHITKLIKPSLESGKYVICDRFSDSTMSYQGYGHMLGRNLIEQLQTLAIGTFKPDLTFILDIKVNTGISRANERGNNENRYEKMDVEFHEKVRQGFIETAGSEKSRCHIINADDTIESIHKQIIEAVNNKMGLALKCQS